MVAPDHGKSRLSARGSAETLPIRAQDVLLVSALLSLAGWGFIAVLERLTARAALGTLVTVSGLAVLQL